MLTIACAGSSTPAKTELDPQIGRSQPVNVRPATDEAAAPGDGQATPEPQPEPEPEPEPSEELNEKVVPAPEDRRVCEHVVAVVVSEAEEPEGFSEGAIEDLVESCAVELARKHLEIGDEAFDRRAACVLSAQSADQMHACDPDPKPAPESK